MNTLTKISGTMMSRTMMSGIAGLALVLTAAAPAFAEERVCRTSIGAVTLDNVRVPSGARCTLTRTKVKGTIKVERNGTLSARDVMVIGNVQAEGATSVVVYDGSSIGGSVQVKQGKAASVTDSRVGGSIQYESNSGKLSAVRNRVDADVQAFSNRGGVNFVRNVIDGNLQCKSNSPKPTGSGNVVGGNKEDQCARL